MMESWQKEHINDNISELLKEIKCTTLFLEIIEKTPDQISFEEFDDLNVTPKNTDKVSKLLRILETRVDAYSALVSALRQTSQSGAVKILAKHPRANHYVSNKDDIPETVAACSSSAEKKQSDDSLVGNEGFGIGHIVMHVEKSPVRVEFLNKWRTLARRLGIPDHNREALAKSLDAGKKDHLDVFEDLLTTWRSQNGSEATMNNLISAIRNSDNNEIAESLTKAFLK